MSQTIAQLDITQMDIGSDLPLNIEQRGAEGLRAAIQLSMRDHVVHAAIIIKINQVSQSPSAQVNASIHMHHTRKQKHARTSRCAQIHI